MSARIGEVAAELYRGDPGGFVAARDRLVASARERGDSRLATELGKLRRPVLAAWALNVLTHTEPDRVDELLALGEQARDAQRDLRGVDLRAFGARRAEILDSLTGEAARLAERAGHSLSSTAAEQVRRTLVAALSDQDAADRLRKGTLTKPIEYSGFGVDEVSESAASLADPVPRPAPSRGKATRAEPEPAAPTTLEPTTAAPSRRKSAEDKRERWEADYERACRERDAAAEEEDAAREDVRRLEHARQAIEWQLERAREEWARAEQ
ncbi:MAG: hypothetical protein ACRDQ5_20385, partial [Sciscionella sp.]